MRRALVCEHCGCTIAGFPIVKAGYTYCSLRDYGRRMRALRRIMLQDAARGYDLEGMR